MAGVTIDGFLSKSLDELKTELENALKASFGNSIDLDPQSNFGQLVGVMAERFADLWALGAAIDNAFSPDSAVGVALDNLAALTGTVRNPATFSTITLHLTGTDGTVIPAGSAASVATIGTRFITDGGVILATRPAWAALTSYTAGDIRRNGGTQRIYACITSGTSAGSGGPTTTASDITDGTVHWMYLGDGAAWVVSEATCSVVGAKIGASGAVTVIETPISGWSGVNNPLDADVGAELETDAALRTRREVELRGAGKASVESIRAALLEVDDVTEATVFENVTDVTDVDGIPPHSIEALVRDGEDADIREAIFAEIAAGIRAHGSTSGTVTDSQGIAHTIKFTRPTEIPIYVALTVGADASLWPSDGAAQAEALVAAWGNAQRSGKDVVASGIEARIFTLSGTLDAVALIKTSATPTVRTTIAIALRELATFDTSNIDVTVNFVTP